MPSRRVLLVDNGSLEPASTLQLRRLARALSERLAVDVAPVSVAHSSKVSADALEGTPAELFDAALTRALADGVDEIVVLPLFVGPSYAIVRHLPAVVAERLKTFASARIEIAAPLFVPGEERLGQILAEFTREQLARWGEARVRVAVVDHGSPSRAVTAVRDAVAAQVRALLGATAEDVAACSMERRPGAEFEFNEPLLENLLVRDAWRRGPLAVALLFIAPGKHAGPDGDVAQIVARVRGETAGAVRFTPVMGTHPLLLEILADRARAALARFASIG